METKKYYNDNKSWFFHAISKTSISHGLENNQNKWIGYWYQDQKKGFWLRK